MPLATARPWLIAVLFGLMALSPTRAGMTDAEVKAFTQDKALAEKGDHVAQYNMGVRYYHGLGVAKDFVQAVSWWRKAAEQGGHHGVRPVLGGAVSKLGLKPRFSNRQIY